MISVYDMVDVFSTTITNTCDIASMHDMMNVFDMIKACDVMSIHDI